MNPNSDIQLQNVVKFEEYSEHACKYQELSF